MTGPRIILHADNGSGSICIDGTGDGALITLWECSGDEDQFLLPPEEARRLGEWLIKRANEGGGE